MQHVAERTSICECGTDADEHRHHRRHQHQQQADDDDDDTNDVVERVLFSLDGPDDCFTDTVVADSSLQLPDAAAAAAAAAAESGEPLTAAASEPCVTSLPPSGRRTEPSSLRHQGSRAFTVLCNLYAVLMAAVWAFFSTYFSLLSSYVSV